MSKPVALRPPMLSWESGMILVLIPLSPIVWIVRPSLFPILAAVPLLLALIPLVQAWRAAKGLAIRSVVAWGGGSVILGLIAETSAFLQPLSTGYPIAGHWAYLATLAALAALISALGARNPGGGAWAILMGLLVLVLLIPWLEGSGLRQGSGGLDRLHIEAPWSIFYGLLVLAGVTNYVPTVFGKAAWWLGSGFVVEFVALNNPSWSALTRGRLWCLAPALFAMGILSASADLRRRNPGEPGLSALWLWFRDLWGVVWALRVRERFQRTAESAGWPFKLSWNGPTTLDGNAKPPVPPEAVKTLEVLLRRFATADRIRAATGPPSRGACPDPESGRE